MLISSMTSHLTTLFEYDVTLFQMMRYYVDQLVNKGSRHQAILLAISLGAYDKAAEILLATKLVTVS